MSEPQPPYASSSQQPNGYPTSPGYPQQAGYPQPAYDAPPAATGSLGRTAFIIALAGVVIGVVFTFITPVIATSMAGHGSYHVLYLMHTLIGIVVGALSLILGIVAARRGAQPVLAGIAIGLGGSELLGIMLSFSSSLLLGMLL